MRDERGRALCALTSAVEDVGAPSVKWGGDVSRLRCDADGAAAGGGRVARDGVWDGWVDGFGLSGGARRYG